MKQSKFIMLITFVSVIIFFLSPFFGASGFIIPSSDSELNIFFNLRIPRVLIGFIVGGGLALTGGMLQSFFRNDLASPYTLGIASTASLGAAISIFFRLPSYGTEFLASTFSLLALFCMLGLYKIKRMERLSSLLLVGISLGLVSSSGIYFLQYAGGIERSFEIYRWLAGGIEVVGYKPVVFSFVTLLLSGFFIFRETRSLDLLQVNEEFARSRGVNVDKVTVMVITTSALIVGIFVSICGPIGFIGLIVPHITRKFTGGIHKIFLPASMILGGIILVVADTLSRIVFAPIEIPVGITTSLVGGPVFLYMVLRR